jgi:hypothetical protein
MLREDRDEQYRAWTLPPLEMEDDNLRYELQPDEARLELRAKGGVTLRAVWPPVDTDTSPFFYLT